MEEFKELDEIFTLLKNKQYGKITNKKVDHCIQQLNDFASSGDDDGENCRSVVQFLSFVKDSRWDQTGQGFDRNKEKLNSIKKWYIAKQKDVANIEQKTDQEYDTLTKLYDGEQKVNHTTHRHDIKQTTDIQVSNSYEAIATDAARQNPGVKSEISIEERSREASKQLLKNNPNIANLNDPNRPTKIAERYSELYDNEWTEAFSCLTEEFGKDEGDSIRILLQIIWTAYEVCFKTAEDDLQVAHAFLENLLEQGRENIDIKKVKEPVISNARNLSYLRQHRKIVAGIVVHRMLKYCKPELKKLFTDINNTKVEMYADKCVEICWWMCVQDPPVHMCIHEAIDRDQPFRSGLYRRYTKSGNTMDFIVWPAVLLHKDGPVLVKGVAQCK